jgi:hypothetical protein
LVQKPGLSARGVDDASAVERPVVAVEDRFGEGDVVAPDEVDVLDHERGWGTTKISAKRAVRLAVRVRA